MINLLESAEFWTSIAFVLVLILAASPAYSRLKKWATKQAKQISDAEKEAELLFQKAQDLNDNYNKSYQNRLQERKKAFLEADKKIAFLEQEIQSKTQEKIHHKKLEVAVRIQNIQENEQQVLKAKLLNRVAVDAQETLLNQPPKEDTQKIADSLCQSLDKFKSVLN